MHSRRLKRRPKIPGQNSIGTGGQNSIGADTAVLASILTLTDEQQAGLLRLATAGDYTTPTCPSCAVKMTKREPKAGGKTFWGCVNFPRCRSIINMAKA